MEITLNGKPTTLETQVTIAELLGHMGIPAPGTAVAVNGEILKREIFDSQKVDNGDRVDILRAIGGG